MKFAKRQTETVDAVMYTGYNLDEVKSFLRGVVDTSVVKVEVDGSVLFSFGRYGLPDTRFSTLAPGQWAVRVGETLTVLPANVFYQRYTPAQ